MAEETSTSLLNSDLTDENESLSIDYMRMDSLASEPTHHPPNLMPDLLPDEELSDDRILKALEQFLEEFTERYPTSGPPLCIGSLHQALAHSLYNQQDTRPLILFIYHDQSASTNVFCRQVLCTNEITNYITANFIVWAWDRTNDINYARLLEMLRTHLGNEVEETVASSPIDTYPMLICLMYNNGRVEITNIIQGHVSHELTLNWLKVARDKFDCRIETPHPADRFWKPVLNDFWSMSPSVLKPIEKTSEEFERIASQFVGQTEQVIQIDEIENSSWVFQYLNQKKAIENHYIDNSIEKILVFPCSQLSAEYILRNGFNNDHKVRTYSHGFHFLSSAVYKNLYPPSNSANGSQKAMLVCRVLVGRTFLINDGMVETCPSEYDSTTDGWNTYIVYSNRSILPKYYIKY